MATTSHDIQKVMLLGLIISSGVILSACQAQYDASQNVTVPVEESVTTETMTTSETDSSGEQTAGSDRAPSSPSPEQKRVVELESQVEVMQFEDEDFSDL